MRIGRQNKHNRPTPEQEAILTAAASPETMEQMAAKAKQVWMAIKGSEDPNIFPGYQSTFDEQTGQAHILKAGKNTRGYAVRISVFPNTDNQWTFQQQDYHENTERDDIDYSLLRRTITYPITVGAVVSEDRDVCRRTGPSWD